MVDGDQRFTYAAFGERCDRWSAALQELGVRQGDRVATIAPNTHEHLEQYYAVPQIGAVIVPMNYRLTADDFIYLANHSGSKVLCVHPDYLALVDGAREQMTTVRHFVALGEATKGWLKYEDLVTDASPAKLVRPQIVETDLLSINYTSGTTSRPKGVMITHRRARCSAIRPFWKLPSSACHTKSGASRRTRSSY